MFRHIVLLLVTLAELSKLGNRMCGIAGIYNYRSEEPVDVHLVDTMCKAITHRGPDDQGIYVRENIGLGMRRLSIIDLSGGHQPITNENDTIWIVFNGEIYNFIELRRELETRGHVFRTRSDTEVVVHAYEEWGTAALAKLNGMYGLALWDSQQGQLILARDPFGVKPLYYWDDGRTLVFGSEIKALLCHPAVDRVVNRTALDQFLTLTFVPSPLTAFEGIKKLPPGHMLVCSPQGSQIKRFYFSPQIDLSGYNDRELVEELQNRIEAAVKRQMIADVPIGAMLSGGVDSSTIATIMSTLTSEPIKTFTVGFSDDFDQDEIEYARSMAKRIGSQHYETVISANEYFDFLPKSIWHLEEPVATASTLAFYQVCKLAHEHVKVVLTGQGADEPFAGYPRHIGEYYGRLYRSIPHFLREKAIAPLIAMLPRNEQAKRAVQSLGIPDPLTRLAQVYTIMDDLFKQDLYLEPDKMPNGDIRNVIEAWQSDVVNRDGFGQMLSVDARFSLPDNLLLYGDKMSMASSIEARVPFLDLELMTFAESIPSNRKIKGLKQKYILKQAVAKWIPRDVITRKKIGFATPIDSWFRSEVNGNIQELLLSSGSASRIYFKPDTIMRMITDHRDGRYDHKRALFSLVTFEVWHQMFIKPARWEAS